MVTFSGFFFPLFLSLYPPPRVWKSYFGLYCSTITHTIPKAQQVGWYNGGSSYI
jgi:hypothetical protein